MARSIKVHVQWSGGRAETVAFPIKPDCILCGKHWLDGVAVPVPNPWADPFHAESIAYAINEGSALIGTLDDEDGRELARWHVENPDALPGHGWRA